MQHKQINNILKKKNIEIKNNDGTPPRPTFNRI